MYLADATIRLRLCALALLACPTLAVAEGKIVPFGFLQYEHTNNKTTTTSDTFRGNLLRLTVGMESRYQLSLQEFFFDAAFGKVANADLTNFASDEHAVRGGLNWVVGRNLDGILEASEVKQVPTNRDLFVSGSSIQKERRLTGGANLQIGQHWRAEAMVISRELETPIEELPQLGLSEDIRRGTFRYLTTARFKFGAEYEDIDGEFRNAPTLSTYTQRTPSGLLEYSVPDVNMLKIKVGQTRREQANQPEPFEETTDEVSYQHILTGKTSLNLQHKRRIDNYFGPDAGAFALISSWNIGINWKSSDRYNVYADYGKTNTHFLGDGVAGQIVTGRTDRASSFNVKLEHNTLPWLMTELYLKIDDVNSNVPTIGYDGVLIGLKFEARLRESESTRKER